MQRRSRTAPRPHPVCFAGSWTPWQPPPPVAPLLPALVPKPPRTKGAKGVNLSSPRRSGRLAQKKTRQALQGSSAVQELIARACNLLDPESEMDAGVQTAYAALFNRPLAAPVILAIETLAKHVKATNSKPEKKKATTIEEPGVDNV